MTLLCKICNISPFQYTCPQCNILYCSVKCYRSAAHLSCSESFYKQQLLLNRSDLKTTKPPDHLVKSLKENENDQDVEYYHSLLKHMKPSDIDELPAELIQQMVEKLDLNSDYEFDFSPWYISQIGIPEPITPIERFKPSQNHYINVMDVLFSYIFVLYTFNDNINDTIETQSMLVLICSVLNNPKLVYKSVDEWIAACKIATTQEPFMSLSIRSDTLLFLFKQVFILLRNRNHVVAALSHVHSILESSRDYFYEMKKVYYLICTLGDSGIDELEKGIELFEAESLDQLYRREEVQKMIELEASPLNILSQ